VASPTIGRPVVAPTDEPMPRLIARPPTPTVPVPVTTAVALTGFRHEWQTWNNCGPATLAMDLSYYGLPDMQADVAKVLKPDREDKNVSPNELVGYARSAGLMATAHVNGSLDRLRALLSHGFPVIVETWIVPKPNDGMGHYRLLIGYDDASSQFTAFDSFIAPGKNLTLTYNELDDEWRVFNRTYVVVHRPDAAQQAEQILGADASDQAMWTGALERSQAEIEDHPDDAFAWFNAGSDLVALARYDEAAQAFDQARRLGLPWRMLWYQFGPFEAYLHVERYQDVLDLAAANLRQAGNLEESHYYRGLALRALGKTDEARQAFEQALKYNPNFAPAQQALANE
jgi:tetratricopeptide (TPR) repeat protein